MCKVFYLKFWKVKTYDRLIMCPSHVKEERQVWTHAELCLHAQSSVGTLKVKLGFKIQTLGALAQPFNIKNSLMYKNVKEWQWQHMKACDWQSPLCARHGARARHGAHAPAHTSSGVETQSNAKQCYPEVPPYVSSGYPPVTGQGLLQHSVTTRQHPPRTSEAGFLLTMDQHK